MSESHSERAVGPQAPAAVGGRDIRADDAAPPLGRAIGRGMTWGFGYRVTTNLMNIAAFAALGLLLAPEDFGLYMLALSIAAFVQVFREGGVVQLLIQRGEREYRDLAGPVFWMALAFNLGTGVVMACAGSIAAAAYGQSKLASLLYVMAASLPLATPGVALAARLRMQLRFGALARIQLFSAAIRYGGTVALAAGGMGPMSFVLPLPLMALYDWAAGWATTRERPWRGPPGLARWGALFSESKAIILGALAWAALNQGGYLVLGMLVPVAVVGTFGFAYQIITQVDALLSATALAVLFPALAQLNSDRPRQAAATVRAVRMIMLLAAPATIGLAAVADPLLRLVWLNKWTGAVVALQALGAFFAIRVAYAVPWAALQARGRFGLNALLLLLCGAGSMAAGALGAVAGGTAEAIGAAVGSYLGAGCLFFIMISMRLLGVQGGRTLGAVLPAWAIAAVAGALTLGADAVLSPHMRPVFLGTRGAELLRLIVLGSVFFAAYAAGTRLVLRAQLLEELGLLPGRLQVVAGKLLGLGRAA